jgi:hypothetical protein
MAYTPASVSTAPSTMMNSEEVMQKKPANINKFNINIVLILYYIIININLYKYL